MAEMGSFILDDSDFPIFDSGSFQDHIDISEFGYFSNNESPILTLENENLFGQNENVLVNDVSFDSFLNCEKKSNKRSRCDDGEVFERQTKRAALGSKKQDVTNFLNKEATQDNLLINETNNTFDSTIENGFSIDDTIDVRIGKNNSSDELLDKLSIYIKTRSDDGEKSEKIKIPDLCKNNISCDISNDMLNIFEIENLNGLGELNEIMIINDNKSLNSNIFDDLFEETPEKSDDPLRYLFYEDISNEEFKLTVPDKKINYNRLKKNEEPQTGLPTLNIFVPNPVEYANVGLDNVSKKNFLVLDDNKFSSVDNLSSIGRSGSASPTKIIEKENTNVEKKQKKSDTNKSNNKSAQKCAGKKSQVYSNVDEFLNSLELNSKVDISALKTVKFSLPSVYDDKIPSKPYKEFSKEEKDTLFEYINSNIVDPIFEITGFRFVTAASTVTMEKYNRRFTCAQDIASQRKGKSSGKRNAPSRCQKSNHCNSSLNITYYVKTRSFSISFKHLTHEPYMDKRVSDEIKEYISLRIRVSPIQIYRELNSDCVSPLLNSQVSNVTQDQIRWWWTKMKE